MKDTELLAQIAQDVLCDGGQFQLNSTPSTSPCAKQITHATPRAMLTPNSASKLRNALMSWVL
jgi:hypothetical protein